MSNKPKPTALKILEGNPGKRPLPKNEPKPDLALMPCPEYLKDDDIAYGEWNRIVPELYKIGLLTKIDKVALELYCSQYSIYRKSFELIKDKSVASVDKRRASQATREAAKIIKTVAVEFGMTPSSRSRISLPGESVDDEFKRLLDG